MSETQARLTLQKIRASLIGIAIYVALAITTYSIHARWFEVDVVLYSALFDVALAAAVAGTGLCLLRPFSVLNAFEKFQLVAIFFLVGYALSISVPTVIDRSLSFYLLEKIDLRGGGIRKSAFERIFVEEYIQEYRLMDVRLTEQVESGTVRIIDGCVLLTDRGRRAAEFSRTFRNWFLPRKRLLNGGYSDALIDPFKQELPETDYRCP